MKEYRRRWLWKIIKRVPKMDKDVYKNASLCFQKDVLTEMKRCPYGNIFLS
jgi:hypothetical protein